MNKYELYYYNKIKEKKGLPLQTYKEIFHELLINEIYKNMPKTKPKLKYKYEIEELTYKYVENYIQDKDKYVNEKMEQVKKNYLNNNIKFNSSNFNYVL